MKKIIILSALFFIGTLYIVYVGYFITPKQDNLTANKPSSRIPATLNTVAYNESAPLARPSVLKEEVVISPTNTSVNEIVTQWEAKYPDLFKELPELEALIMSPDTKDKLKAIDIIAESRFLKTSIEIITYLMVCVSEPSNRSGSPFYPYCPHAQLKVLQENRDAVIPELIKLLRHPDVI